MPLFEKNVNLKMGYAELFYNYRNEKRKLLFHLQYGEFSLCSVKSELQAFGLSYGSI